MAESSTVAVNVIPDDTGLRVEVYFLSSFHVNKPVRLESMLIIGKADAPGPSDHDPSYSPGDSDRLRPVFAVILAQGAALGWLRLAVDGEMVWSTVFQRFAIVRNQPTVCDFVDHRCVLEIPKLSQDAYVVVLRNVVPGPGGDQAVAYVVSAAPGLLSKTSMNLRLAAPGSAKPASLSGYRSDIRRTKPWVCIPASNPASVGQEVIVPITDRGMYALGSRCP